MGFKGSSTIATVQRFYWVRLLHKMFNCSNLAQKVSYRFFGLFGVYYSLEYLSLSDSTVLTFLVPMCTALAGALFLGEKFSCREVFAGRKWTIPISKKIHLLKTISREFGGRCSDCTAYRYIWLYKPFCTHRCCNRKSTSKFYKSCRKRNSDWKIDSCWVR